MTSGGTRDFHMTSRGGWPKQFKNPWAGVTNIFENKFCGSVWHAHALWPELSLTKIFVSVTLRPCSHDVKSNKSSWSTSADFKNMFDYMVFTVIGSAAVRKPPSVLLQIALDVLSYYLCCQLVGWVWFDNSNRSKTVILYTCEYIFDTKYFLPQSMN